MELKINEPWITSKVRCQNGYLIDSNRSFKLVYDFQVSNGKLKKLFDSNMTENDVLYWKNVISEIQKETPSWNWAAYDFDGFMNHISVERVVKKTLEEEIEKSLIEHYFRRKRSRTNIQSAQKNKSTSSKY